MSDSAEVEEPEFRWCRKRGLGGKKKDVQFYESFTYDGVDYCLYDCVYMYKEGEPAPYIGKLVKIWENSDKSKKIKVHWFFRPSEISYYLKGAKVLEKELFFASGAGTGLANLNPLEAIAGKCNIVCISADNRNPRPSAEELEMADYVFYRVFDVKSCSISDQIGDTVGGLEVKFVFNRKESDRTLDVSKLNSNSIDEGRNAVNWEETPTDKYSSQQLKNENLEENCNYMLEKELANLKPVKVNQESVLREIKNVPLNEEPTPGGNWSPVAHANYNIKDKEVMGIVEKRSTLAAKHGECKVNGEKDKAEAIKSHVNQVQVEERTKSVRKSCHLDDTPTKRAKFNGTFTSLNDKSTTNVENLISPGKDEKQLVAGAISSNVKSKPECIETFVRSGKDPKLAENSNAREESISRTAMTFSNQTPKSRHSDVVTGLDKGVKSAGDLDNLKGGLWQTSVFASRENSEVVHVKDSISHGKDDKQDEKLDSCAERLLRTNVSSNETTRLSKAYVSPDVTPKSGFDKDCEGKAAKVVKSSGASMKRPLQIDADLSKEKSNPRGDAGHDNEDPAQANDACASEKSFLKKGKFDDSVKISEDKDKAISNLKKKIGVNDERKSANLVPSSEDKAKSRFDKGPSRTHQNEETGKISNGSDPKLSNATLKRKDDKVEGQIFEVTRRSIGEKSKWIKLPWEQRMKTAFDQGRLVFLQNFDPEYTSGEIEDIIWHAFQENCTARVVQHTAISNPFTGQAFAIFKTPEAAERVVTKLDDGCLMLPNRRPLLGFNGVSPKLFEKQTAFVGHLAIDKARRQIQRETKEAVSTSHYSQNNTIEYEMAMAWRLLQSKSDIWWEKLYEQQRKDLKKVLAGLKSK